MTVATQKAFHAGVAARIAFQHADDTILIGFWPKLKECPLRDAAMREYFETREHLTVNGAKELIQAWVS